MRNRSTVRWHEAALAEAGKIWLAAKDRSLVSQAINEVDQLLQVDPASKGVPFALARLDRASIFLIEERSRSLPEDLRVVSLGPLEIFFLPREADAMVLVYMVRRR